MKIGVGNNKIGKLDRNKIKEAFAYVVNYGISNKTTGIVVSISFGTYEDDPSIKHSIKK